MSEISPDSMSYLMSNLSAGREYSLKLAAKNLVGLGKCFTHEPPVRTLDMDPEFVPEISIKGITKNAISVGWTDPPEAVAPYIHFYKVTKRAKDQTAEIIHSQPFPIHLWDGLAPATRYLFTVAACNRYSGECSAASPLMSGSTYDGVAGPPLLLVLDGVTYSHLIDPRTGEPLTNHQSCTAIASTAIDADAAATALSVLGRAASSQRFETLPIDQAVLLYCDATSDPAQRSSIRFSRLLAEK